MSLYWHIFRFRALRFLAYPTEMLATIVKRILEITFFVFLWTLVLKSSSATVTVQSLISYFLIASGIGEIVMAKWGGTGKFLADSVRQGKLSNYLIKPVSIIPNLFFSELGTNIPKRILALIFIIVGVALNPPQTLTAVFLFMVFFVASFVIALCYVILLGCMYFYVPEASGIKNSIEHMARILSGAAVPLTFFPESMFKVVKLLPFQTMIYAPTNALSTNSISTEVLGQIVVSYFWLVVFVAFAWFVWRQSIKHYEAAGI